MREIHVSRCRALRRRAAQRRRAGPRRAGLRGVEPAHRRGALAAARGAPGTARTLPGARARGAARRRTRAAAVSQAGTRRRMQAAGAELLDARLVVAADGAQSLVRARPASARSSRITIRSPWSCTWRPTGPPTGIAYERFTATGPLAVLPLADGRYTVVWTLAPERAAQAAGTRRRRLRRRAAAQLRLAHRPHRCTPARAPPIRCG